MLSYARINSHSQVSDPGPEGPLVLCYLEIMMNIYYINGVQRKFDLAKWTGYK